MRTDLRFRSDRNDPSPFFLGPKQRKLRLFVDSEHIASNEVTQLLHEFASYGEVWAAATTGNGERRVMFGKRRGDDLDVLPVRVIRDEGVINTGIVYVSQWDHFAREPILKDGLVLPAGPWTDHDYRLRQYLLAQTAVSLGVDVFATDDRFLLEFRRPDFIDLNFLSSRDALSLIGSYLRNRGDFTILKSKYLINRLNRWLFYLVLGRDILPGGWRWFSAIVESDKATGGDLVSVGGSLVTRVTQALKARDHLHWQLLQTHDIDTADDSLFYLDMMLLSLSAAFDVVARIADAVLALGSQPQHVSWNSKSWRSKLRKAERGLDALMAPNRPHGQAHRVTSLLRNSIHGEALHTVAYQNEREPLENLLVLPKANRDELRFLIDQLGGRDLWGFEDLAGMFTCVRPGKLTEQLLPRAASALNDLIALTPVDKLPGIMQHTQLMVGPPTDDAWWSEDTRRRVRLLSGL